MPKDDTRAKQRLTPADAQQFELPFVEESAPKFDLTKLHDLVLFSQNLLRETGDDSLADTVTIRWNSRMQTTAGTACFARTQVTLNPKLMQFVGELGSWGNWGQATFLDRLQPKSQKGRGGVRVGLP